MGNTCRVLSPGEDFCREKKQDSTAIVVLQGNGEVMELRREVRAEELMRDFPNHFLCHASSILLRRKSKMIQPKVQLQAGSIYLLLPFPSSSEAEELDGLKDQDPLLVPPQTTGTTKFVISKHYLDRILSEKSSSNPKKKGSSSSRRRLQQRKVMKRVDCSSRNTTQAQTRKSAISWSPELDSIPEK